jgi:uncharacterized phage-associated protein
MYDAMTIAKWFVAYAEADEADSSNLKIQKLLYYAQGHHLAATGERLFPDPIQAWSHGPVVPSVYHAFKVFRSGDVHLADDDDFDFDDVDDGTTQFLLGVWDAYAKYSPWGLRNMTHSEPPWVDTFDGKRNVEIPVESIHKYFANL